MIVKRLNLVGFNAKKTSEIKPTKINNEMKIKSIEKADEEVKFQLTFSVVYEDLANLSLEYEAFCDVENADQLIKDFKESKNLKSEDFGELLNIVLKNGMLEAFVLGKELRLYPPFKLPGVKI
ncbi:MAG: hypothetical protein PHT94_02350 [Candidatus Nanoarchaeia archaeon]|nr:hypothetical protein [Candidatus Nanoarchaeia archaeon]